MCHVAPTVVSRTCFLTSPFSLCWANSSQSTVPPHEGQGGKDPGSLPLKHCDEKKELVEGAKSQTDGNAMVIIELRTGGVRIMRKGDYQQLLGSRRKASVLKVRRGGNQKVGVAVLLQPLRARQQAAGEKLATQGWAASDGLVVAHVPDLSSLGLLMQQRKTSQVF